MLHLMTLQLVPTLRITAMQMAAHAAPLCLNGACVCVLGGRGVGCVCVYEYVQCCKYVCACVLSRTFPSTNF